MTDYSENDITQNEAPEQEESSKPKAEKKRKRSRFFIGMSIYLGALAVLSAVLLTILWVTLDRLQGEYEQQSSELAAELAAQQAQREHEKAVHRAPQLAFEAWLSGLTPDYWTDLWYARTPCDLDPRDKVHGYMEECFSPESIEAFKSSDFTAEAPVYVLKNGSTTLARITVSGSELDWSVSQVELLIEGSESAAILATSDSRVFCNGRELGSEYYEEENISFFQYTPLKDALTSPVSWVRYKVEGLLFEPEVTTEAPSGCRIAQTPQGEYLLCMQGGNDEYINKAIQFVKAYLYYYMSGKQDTGTNLANALSYLTPGTQAYLDLQSTYSGVAWNADHWNINTDKTTADDMAVWSDNCRSVDVTFDADGIYNGEAVNYAGVMRIYFLNTGSGFFISNFEIL